MGYNIVDAAKDLITTGKVEIADDETILERINTCGSCEIRNALTNICTACGCFIPAKARLKKSECPLDLWEK